jgi:hypothetical protein
MATNTFKICNTYLLSYGNNGYANVPQCYIYMYIACLVMHHTTLINVKVHPLTCHEGIEGGGKGVAPPFL